MNLSLVLQSTILHSILIHCFCWKIRRIKMSTFRFETTIAKDGTLSINGIPFTKGDKVEVLVRGKKSKSRLLQDNRYSLRGTPIKYIDPFDSIASDEWSVIQ